MSVRAASKPRDIIGFEIARASARQACYRAIPIIGSQRFDSASRDAIGHLNYAIGALNVARACQELPAVTTEPNAERRADTQETFRQNVIHPDALYLLEGIAMALDAIAVCRTKDAIEILKFCVSSSMTPPVLTVRAKPTRRLRVVDDGYPEDEFQQTADWPAGVRF